MVGIFRTKIGAIFAYGVIFLSLILLLFLAKNSGVPRTEISEQSKNITFPVTPTKVPELFIGLDDASAAAVLIAANPNNNYIGMKALVYSSDPVTIPALLSDYDAILVINHYSGLNYSPIGDSFSPIFAGEAVSFEANVLNGTKHTDANGKIRATLKPNRDLAGLGHSGIQIFAHDEETFLKLVKIAERSIESKYPDNYRLSETILPRLTLKKTNYSDPNHPYTYYLPTKYRSEASPQGYPNTYFSSPDEDRICLSFKEDRNDPCSFSTSGCTCCNTGCRILDYAVYATRDGQVFIDPILQKGAGQVDGTLFVYNSPHPWIYYSATFSSPKNNPRGVLDLIYLLDSMERNY